MRLRVNPYCRNHSRFLNSANIAHDYYRTCKKWQLSATSVCVPVSVCAMPKSKLRSKRGAGTPVLKHVSVMQALLVGEYLSFRRAARALGVRQSAVSRRIRELEDELGVSLFERDRAGVRVTNAGALFLEQARSALEQLSHAAKAAGAAGRGAVGKLSVGILSSMGGGFLRNLMERYSQKHPDVLVQILEGVSADHLVAVRKRQLDAALILNTTDSVGLEVAPLWNERIFVALPEHHGLRGRKEIEWRDLRHEHLIVRQSDRDPALCDRLARRLSADDEAPNVETYDVSRETLMHLVALGRGIGLTSEATIATPFPKVVFRPVAGEDAVLQFCAVWSSPNDNPALRRFLSLAQTMAKETSRTPSPGSGPASSRSTLTSRATLLLAFLGALARRLGLLT
jgi:DNA-binding transcriptional LysR family regulator